jgi:tetratricopeptide (TPR) repeat protein
MLTYASMMSGQSALALRRIREAVQDIPLDFYRANPFADGFMAMPLEVLMRFGRWQEILAEPAFPEFVPISRTLQHYARGVAFAATGRMPDAEQELAAFLEARAKLPKEAFFGNNTASDLLDVAERVLRGELAFRAGRHDEGIALLRDGVSREDKLRYDEPPDWIQPVRHPLGAALLAAGRFAEAEAVFREDLAKLPENGWGLYGLERALALQKKRAEAAEVQKRFDAVWSKADLKIQSPCLCLPGV